LFDFLTLDDVDAIGKRVLLRVDINSPIDPKTGQITDDKRIRATLETLRDLRKARVTLMSHQGRPGKYDFTSLSLHAEILKKYAKRPIRFIGDVMGPAAMGAISELSPGEVLVLENVRFSAEENIEGSSEELAKTHLVRKLAPFFDLFVNDAFATAHRAQASLIGFAEVLPTVAGRIMERELKAIGGVLSRPKHPLVFVVGGVKVEDRIPAIQSLLDRGVVDSILVGGLVGEIFLKAKGYKLGKATDKKIENYKDQVEEAKKILSKYSKRIVTPTDVAIRSGKKRRDISVSRLPTEETIRDIGVNTINSFSRIIRNANTVVASGPLGVFEEEGFEKGTERIVEAIAQCKGFTLIGGGHLDAIVEKLKLEGSFSHISTGGGAMLTFLTGKKLPAIEALERAAQRMKAS